MLKKLALVIAINTVSPFSQSPIPAPRQMKSGHWPRYYSTQRLADSK